MALDAAGRFLGWLLLAGYAALTALWVPRYFRSALAPLAGEPTLDEAPAPGRRVLLWTLTAFIASRLLVALVCAAACLVESGGLAGFWPNLWARLFPWDARHYVNIIENGYVAVGDDRLLIVFFPLYPMVCRCLSFMTGMPAVPAALAVSNLALLGCGGAVWRLAEADGGETLGRRAMLMLMFSPMTYFFSIAYSESLFLLVTLLAVLMARRRRFGWALAFGAMASGARLLGMATAIPIYWELLRAARERRGENAARQDLIRDGLLCALKTLPVSLGFLCYLCINHSLFGNPTQFLVFQREHWFQRFGSLANTFRYCLANAVEYDDHLYQLGVWRPQVLLLIALPLLILWRGRRERPGDVAYALVYHYVAFAPTWLLSGPRYAACNYALYPLLARIPRSRRGFAALLAGEGAALAYMTVVGLWLGKVY